MSSANGCELDWPQILSFGRVKQDIKPALNPFPNKPWFLRVCSKSLLKTLWEKEKLLGTSLDNFLPFL